MKVALYDRYGGPDVVELRSAPVPLPGPGELVVKVRAAALNPKDIIIQSGRLPLFRLLAGPRFPKRLGYDWSGEVLSVGPGVDDLASGDQIFGMIDRWAAGACATHVVVRRSELARKPANVSWESAAALPLAGQTALQALRDVAELRPGARVLVNGASGGVGTFAVPIAKVLGAHVTAVTSAKNFELVTSIGADEVVDYEAGGFLAALGRFDVFFDVFGNRSFAFARTRLTAGGVYVTTVPKPRLLRDVASTLFGRQRARLVRVRSRASDLVTLADWAERGLLRPVIDSVYPLAEIAAAETRVASRRARGKVVVAIGTEDT